MIVTLAWKELREHQGVWLTMVAMSVLLGVGISRLVALDDPGLALPVATLTVLGLAAAYGAVCGSMMLAGEKEGGTLAFLDIFLGRRGLLWIGKFAIGMVLAVTQALAVSLILRLLNQESSSWVSAIVGQDSTFVAVRGAPVSPTVWFIILPVVTLEAFFWGMLGSSLTQRVLSGAAVAAGFFTPVLLMALCAPPHVFVFVRLLAVAVCLAFSFANFLRHLPGTAAEPQLAPVSESARQKKDEFLQQWERYERAEEWAEDVVPVSLAETSASAPDADWEERPAPRPLRPRDPEPDDLEEPTSPSQVLWWLTFKQAQSVLIILVVVIVLLACVIPANFQVLWPVMTMLLGVACGTAAFAPEQRDLSYQFLAAQHFPLRAIWRFKIVFWLTLAVLLALLLLAGTLLIQFGRRMPPFGGTLHDLIGSTLFLGIWLLHGFAVGQLFVWLSRKAVLALLISTLVSVSAIGVWFPSLLCGGMGGWQMAMAPLTMLLATWCLMRAWAGGRISERKPMTALLGFGSAIVVWALLTFGYRACEVADVGAPLDPIAFRDSVPTGDANAAGKAILNAVAQSGEKNDPWMDSLAEVARLPVGVIEAPRADGQPPGLTHLPVCRKMTDKLLNKARASEPHVAFDYLAQILALSRNLRNKAPIESYLAGIELERQALTGLDQWHARAKPSPKLLRRVLTELNRHARETPPPLDCVRTECYRSGGALANPAIWTFTTPDGAGTIPETWLTSGIALSMETPWEAERRTRLWQMIWSGLFRAVETPHWQQPTSLEEIDAQKPATRAILKHWLPAPDGAGASRAPRAARLLDSSWLADERIFPTVTRLRQPATRARWQVDAMRQVLALALYQIEERKPARTLHDLLPKFLPDGLPSDPYSGEAYRFRIDPQVGKAFVWSTGPDGTDHGGRKDGSHLRDDDPQWARGEFDLVVQVPRWP